MQATLDRIKYILDNGRVKGDRTGTGTISIPTMDFTFDTRKDTPMLTSRKQKWENPFYEWKWFLSGSQVIDYLLEVGCPYWNEWATKEPVYAQVPMQIYERMHSIEKAIQRAFKRQG